MLKERNDKKDKKLPNTEVSAPVNYVQFTYNCVLVFNFVSSLSKIQKIYTSAHDNFVTASLLLLLTTRKGSLDG